MIVHITGEGPVTDIEEHPDSQTIFVASKNKTSRYKVFKKTYQPYWYITLEDQNYGTVAAKLTGRYTSPQIAVRDIINYEKTCKPSPQARYRNNKQEKKAKENAATEGREDS